MPDCSPGSRIFLGKRVQIPAWSTRWMRGDRYGEIVKEYGGLSVRVKLDKSGDTVGFHPEDLRFVD